MAGQEAPDPEDRTEAATPRRLEKAREEGEVALSREAVGFATLLAAALAALVTLPGPGLAMLVAMRALLAAPGTAAAVEVLRTASLLVLPVVAAVAVAAVASTLAQTGWPGRGLRLDAARINPWAGLKRLFGLDALGELLRTVLKLGAVALALWVAVDPRVLGAAMALSPAALLQHALADGWDMFVATLIAFGLLALGDLVWTRLRFQRRMRMTRTETRDEMREAEGDPMLKAKRRRIAEARVRRRMLAEVPKAAVVITNPTHYAVALAYEHGDTSAPRLVAKGVDAMAARIREAAEEHGVPVVANPPLARALWRLQLDTAVPPEHWQAVAEILAYVWRLRHRMIRGGQHG
jgi:flagellar biosynthetic protein FlhB